MLITWTQIYASPNLHKDIKAEISSLIASSVASPKFWERPNILNLNEQQYFFWTPPLKAQNDKIC